MTMLELIKRIQESGKKLDNTEEGIREAAPSPWAFSRLSKIFALSAAWGALRQAGGLGKGLPIQ